ncbi:hypothetical protein DL770_002814 [Monosporascus sp. CRB-9-2]|nr:hypothetical protein DL770_002814 [Monosporascus sp. CRB-9-2]
MAPRRGKLPKTLIHNLPDDGFEWRSLYGQRPLLSNQVARQINKALKRLLPIFTEHEISRAIIKMFRAATDNISGPITSSPEQFWGVVKQQVAWLRDLDDHTILLFSWAVCSARNVAHEHYTLELDLQGKTVEDYPMPTTETTRAVTDFGLKLRATQSFEVIEKLLPSWIYDSHNQGDKASTQAAFEQSIEYANQGLTMFGNARNSGEAEGDEDEEDEEGEEDEEDEEDEDDDDVEMGEAEEDEDVVMEATFELAFRPDSKGGIGIPKIRLAESQNHSH